MDFQVEKVQIINIVLDALIAEVIDVSDMTQIIRWNVVIIQRVQTRDAIIMN